jgi:hypothetical protein
MTKKLAKKMKEDKKSAEAHDAREAFQATAIVVLDHAS